MTTSTPIADSKLFRVVGIRMPSAAQQQAAQQAMIARLHHATRNGEMDWTHLHVPSNPVSAVYEDESGAQFVGMSTPLGPQMIEFDNVPEFDPMTNASDGGFLSLDRLSSMSSNQSAAQAMMMSTLTVDAAKSLMSKPMSDGGPSITESILKSMAMGIGQKAVGNVLVGLASGGDNGKLISDFVASTTTADGLTKLGGSLASGLISNVIGMGVSAAMSKWEVDDESSTAEHAAKKAAEAMVDKLQSELMNLIDEQIANALGTAGPAQAPVPPGSSPKSLTDKIAEFFTGPTSTASVPVGCIGCGNTNDGIVLTGGRTVIVGGLPVSRLSDQVTMTKPIPDIGPLMSGNPTVLSLSLPTAGDGHVSVGGKGVVTLLQNCVPTVLMGPQGMPVVTPTPKEMVAAPSSNYSSTSPASEKPGIRKDCSAAGNSEQAKSRPKNRQSSTDADLQTDPSKASSKEAIPSEVSVSASETPATSRANEELSDAARAAALIEETLNRHDGNVNAAHAEIQIRRRANQASSDDKALIYAHYWLKGRAMDESILSPIAPGLADIYEFDKKHLNGWGAYIILGQPSKNSPSPFDPATNEWFDNGIRNSKPSSDGTFPPIYSSPTMNLPVPYIPYMAPKDAPPGTLQAPFADPQPPVGGFSVDPFTGKVTYG